MMRSREPARDVIPFEFDEMILCVSTDFVGIFAKNSDCL